MAMTIAFRNEMNTYRIPVCFRTEENGGIRKQYFSANTMADAEAALFKWSEKNGIEIHEIV